MEQDKPKGKEMGKQDSKLTDLDHTKSPNLLANQVSFEAHFAGLPIREQLDDRD